MILLKLAYKNLVRTGIRLWINAIVIAFSIVIIVFSRGLYAGMGYQMMTSLINTEIAGGQFWAKGFDPLDPVTFDESYSVIPPSIKERVKGGTACSILYSSGTLYYEGRVIPVTLRGIEPEQKVIDIPTKKLAGSKRNGSIPVLVGKRMLETMKFIDGDTFVVKWRDSNGVFDGSDFIVVKAMDTINPRVDSNVLWLSLDLLQKMLVTEGKASLIVAGRSAEMSGFDDFKEPQWVAHSQDKLTAWVRQIVRDKERGGFIIFSLLLFLSCVGIFNSQTLAVFKRRKEIGMLMALGMRRLHIIALFTYEGVLTAILAILIAMIGGAPIFYWTATTGLSLAHVKDSGAPLPERLAACYTLDQVVVTIGVIFILTTIVSWYPTSKISKLTPVKALTGRH